ncbi:hypothetical protein PRIPAC_92121 [Pristionchus pacificus]|uniref:Uncharacterized protein n=1 Tax=Pristionchus pacificus TaxID=54126 RepID=A0A2A6BR05_PRIPA|nr:hypothetical protein PRIPAC_92121 [Pristionchus pacificus]|eukprot:PDM68325.1 hypothetical protein PRIPAC_46369 [Pristionchus pacificus]
MDDSDSSAESNENKADIPTLPHDLMLMIFGELSDKSGEREPLRTSCKRFREIDVYVGRRYFEEVAIKWIDNEVSIVGTNPDEIPFCEKTIIEHVEHHMRLFRKCKTVNLFITVQSIDCDDLFNIEYILKNIFFDKIQVTLNFMRALVTHSNLEQSSSVKLEVYSTGPLHDVARTQSLLLKLPPLPELHFSYVRRSSNDHEASILDDRTLLQLISNHKRSQKASDTVADREVDFFFLAVPPGRMLDLKKKPEAISISAFGSTVTDPTELDYLTKRICKKASAQFLNISESTRKSSVYCAEPSCARGRSKMDKETSQNRQIQIGTKTKACIRPERIIDRSRKGILTYGIARSGSYYSSVCMVRLEGKNEISKNHLSWLPPRPRPIVAGKITDWNSRVYIPSNVVYAPI